MKTESRGQATRPPCSTGTLATKTDANGVVTGYTYDSQNSYDQMERAVGMTDAVADVAIVSGIQYGLANQMLQITYGDLNQWQQFQGVTETRTYNSLLPLTGINAGSVNLTYNYTAVQNNGKIASTANNVSGEQVVYTYDSLNRPIQAQAASGAWGQAFVYDGFGNLYQKNGIALRMCCAWRCPDYASGSTKGVIPLLSQPPDVDKKSRCESV